MALGRKTTEARGDFGGVAEVGGNQTLLPPNMPVADVQTAMDIAMGVRKLPVEAMGAASSAVAASSAMARSLMDREYADPARMWADAAILPPNADPDDLVMIPMWGDKPIWELGNDLFGKGKIRVQPKGGSVYMLRVARNDGLTDYVRDQDGRPFQFDLFRLVRAMP